MDSNRNTTEDHKNNDRGNINSLVDGFDHSPVAIIGISAQAVICYVNDAAISAFDLDWQSVKDLHLFELFTDESANKLNEASLLAHQPITDKEFTINVYGEKRRVLIRSLVLSGDDTCINTYLFIQDISGYRKREDLYLYLNHAATSLVKARDTHTALGQIAEFIVPSFSDWFTIDVIRGNSLELILLKHEDPAKIEWAYQYRKRYPPDLNGDAGAAVVLKTGQPGYIPVVTDEMIDLTVTDPVQKEEVRKIGLHSVIMAPIWTNDKISGIVNFISCRSDRHFDEEDLHFALNFANLIGLALENTRLNDDASREIFLRQAGEDRFKFLLDAIPHKMWTSGPDGQATYYNQRWYDYTGVQGFKNLKEKIWGFIHPEDLLEAATKWPQAVKSGEDMEMEHRLRKFDGNYRWHLSRFRAQKNDRNEVTLWVGTSTDIHDQKNYELGLAAANEEITATNEELFATNEELEAANEKQLATNEELIQAQETLQNTLENLKASQQRFQIILDSIPQIAWSSTAAGEVEYYNQRWYDYTGLSFEQTKNQGWKRVIHPDDLSQNLEQLFQIIKSQKSGEYEVREKNIDGVYRWHLVRLTPLFDKAGRLEQWIGTATDIEQLKKLQQQKDDFISIASHELRTPLTTLKSSIQLLYRMKDKVSPEKFPVLIEQANRSVHKMTALIEELLNVNRIKEPQLALQKRWFILSELVNACCNHIAVAGQHEFVIIGDKTLKVFADESAIDQVIVNLVNNAVKYAPGSKKIFIIIESKNNTSKLSVKDAGPGIPADQLPLIFNRYYQAGKQNYRNPGLGLGLYISSEIIKHHGGEMGVESELGKGSTFWFTLPQQRST